MDDKTKNVRIEIREKGPAVVHGEVTVEYPDGTEERRGNCPLCRCGRSGTPPFCDASHLKNEE